MLICLTEYKMDTVSSEVSSNQFKGNKVGLRWPTSSWNIQILTKLRVWRKNYVSMCYMGYGVLNQTDESPSVTKNIHKPLTGKGHGPNVPLIVFFFWSFFSFLLFLFLWKRK